MPVGICIFCPFLGSLSDLPVRFFPRSLSLQASAGVTSTNWMVHAFQGHDCQGTECQTWPLEKVTSSAATVRILQLSVSFFWLHAPNFVIVPTKLGQENHRPSAPALVTLIGWEEKGDNLRSVILAFDMILAGVCLQSDQQSRWYWSHCRSYLSVCQTSGYTSYTCRAATGSNNPIAVSGDDAPRRQLA